MARLIDLNEYLDSLPEAIFSDKIGVTESEKYIFNRMPDSQSKNAYVQGFDCESTSFQKAVNLFQQMEIAESIYEGLVEPSY